MVRVKWRAQILPIQLNLKRWKNARVRVRVPTHTGSQVTGRKSTDLPLHHAHPASHISGHHVGAINPLLRCPNDFQPGVLTCLATGISSRGREFSLYCKHDSGVHQHARGRYQLRHCPANPRSQIRIYWSLGEQTNATRVLMQKHTLRCAIGNEIPPVLSPSPLTALHVDSIREAADPAAVILAYACE